MFHLFNSRGEQHPIANTLQHLSLQHAHEIWFVSPAERRCVLPQARVWINLATESVQGDVLFVWVLCIRIELEPFSMEERSRFRQDAQALCSRVSKSCAKGRWKERISQSGKAAKICYSSKCAQNIGEWIVCEQLNTAIARYYSRRLSAACWIPVFIIRSKCITNMSNMPIAVSEVANVRICVGILVLVDRSRHQFC